MEINYVIVDELIELDPSVQEAITLLREVNRSNLTGLSTLYAWFVNHNSRRSSIHGNGCIIRVADDKSADVWLTLSGCWSSGKWVLRLLVGTSPFGFGAAGVEVAQLALPKRNYDYAKKLMNAPFQTRS